MLQNIDKNKYEAVRASNDDAREIIDTLLENHKLIVSTISHEIRNPLTLVYSSLQLLMSQHPELKDYTRFQSVVTDVEYMKVLLEELSTYNNSQRLKKETIDATTYLKRIVLSFAISIEDSEIEFTSAIPSLYPQITVDKTKLQEVFLNILKNAREAVDKNGKIAFIASISDDNLHIEIRNNGPAIPPEHLDTIFEPFQTFKQDGTGLGLAISKQVVESHGGTLSVNSCEGRDTTFTISLPIG